MSGIAKFLILVVIGISPVYIFESGSPQPSDLLAVFYVCVVAIGGMVLRRWRYPTYGMPAWHLLLVLWVAVINIIWAIALSSSAFIMPVLFYLYNFLVVISIMMCLRYVKRFEKWLAISIAAGLIVSGIGVLYSLGSHGRTAGFFNNPNQLAYFSLLGLCALVVSSDLRLKFGAMYVLAYTGAIAGIFAAASLGAWVGLVMLIAAVALNVVRGRARGVVAASIFVALSVIVVQGINTYNYGLIEENFKERINRASYKIDGMYEQRRYDRIVHNLEYVYFGAGEADYETRFYPYVSTEIHSSFGTLLFAYGVVGLFLFCGLIFSAVRKAPLQVWIVVAAPLVYSLTHMGLRTTLFWVLLAMVWFKYSDISLQNTTRALEARPA